MKKIVLLCVMALFATATLFAQTKNVKKAYRISEALEDPDFYQAIELIEPALKDPSTMNDPYTWWVAGHIYDAQIRWENTKAQQFQSSEESVKQEAAFKAYDYFIKAAELEKLPNAKGKVVNKLTKKIAETMKWYYEVYFLLNYGVAQAQYEDYKTAVASLEKHTAILDLPYVASLKNAPKKDSMYYKVKYYTAIYAQLGKTEDKAIEIFEEIKDKGYEENKIYQFLYTIYQNKKDTLRMNNIVDAGIERFPNEFFYLGTKINTMMSENRTADALIYLDKAIQQNPNNSEYYTVKGNLLKDLNRNDEALVAFDKAIELDPSKPINFYNKGVFFYNEAEKFARINVNAKDAQMKAKADKYFADAKACFEKAIQLNENDSDSYRFLKNIAFRNEDMTEYQRLDDKLKAIND